MFLVMSSSSNNNPTMLFAIPAILLLLLLSFSPSVTTMAQQQTPGATTTAPTTPSSPPPSLTTGQTTAAPTTPLTPPLTPEEQEQLTRLQNVIAATNQNLEEAEKQVGGVVYTPRWSDPVWVQPDSAAVFVAYCLPGEFAESGQEILSGFELEVLESYEVALPQNFMAWMMVIGNEDRQNRYPAAVGVICASDANDPQTRVVSPQEQQQINNVVQQIRTSTSIDQVINIINNNNNNATTTTTPPPPPQNGNTTTTPTTPPLPGGGTTPGGPITASLSANPATYEGPCPIYPDFTGTITDNVGNRDVTYRFFDSTGATTIAQTIHFNQPGSTGVETVFGGDTSFQGWVAIEILQPIQLQSNRAEFQITCTASPVGPAPTSTDSITVSLVANPATYNGPCPLQIEFRGTITDNVGNRDVGYRFIFSNGAIGQDQVIHFDQPGSQTVGHISLGGGEDGPPQEYGWAAIEILQPVQLQSNRAEFQITCTAPDTGGAPQTLQAETDTTTAGTTTTDEEDDEEDTTTDGTGDTTGTGGGSTDDTQSPTTDDDTATDGTGDTTDDDAEPQ